MQGWLKGTNSTSLSPVHDMGGDGNGPHTAGQYIARDATGFALHYYDNDYKAIGAGVTPFPELSGYRGTDARPLYNGNISSMAVQAGFHIGNQVEIEVRYNQLIIKKVSALATIGP